MREKRQDEVFIDRGGQTGPRRARWLGLVAMLCVTGMALVGSGLGSRAEDPASRQARPDDKAGEQVLRGHLSHIGHPALHLPPSPAFPRGRVMLLAGDSKRAAELPAHAGPVELRGSVQGGGALEMFVVDAPARPLDDARGLSPAGREPLGRRRIAGKICVGACDAGATRPGAGVAHRACAGLCPTGDLPAILVATDPVDGGRHLLLAGPDGGPPPAALRDAVAIPVELEGHVERVGNVLLLRLDAQPVKRL